MDHYKLSRLPRGCSTTTTVPRLFARTSVRTAARAASWATPPSAGRCSGTLAKIWRVWQIRSISTGTTATVWSNRISVHTTARLHCRHNQTRPGTHSTGGRLRRLAIINKKSFGRFYSTSFLTGTTPDANRGLCFSSPPDPPHRWRGPPPPREGNLRRQRQEKNSPPTEGCPQGGEG